jgi:hypothetical protein
MTRWPERTRCGSWADDGLFEQTLKGALLLRGEVDRDPVHSAGHRRRLVAELEEPGTIGFGVHFADVQFGQVRRDGAGPVWQPLDA